LYAGGQAVSYDFPKTLFVKANLPDHHLVRAVDAKQMDKAKQGTNTLGDSGCHSGGTHIHIQNTHKQQVQNDVDAGRDHQIIQRMAAVPNGVEDAHKDIVHHNEGGAPKVTAEIADRLGENVFGCPHPLQNDGGQRYANDRQSHAGHKAEGDGGVDGFSHGLVLLGAEAPGDDHAGTHSKTLEKADHHENETAGGTDRRKGIVVNKESDTPGVKSVIKLLKYIPQEDGHSKQQHAFPNGTLSQRIVLGMQNGRPPLCEIFIIIARCVFDVNTL